LFIGFREMAIQADRAYHSSAVWDPQQDKQGLEMIQRRTARYVANKYHNISYVSDMLDQLEWPSLESR
jgi:hypothetical protein